MRASIAVIGAMVMLGMGFIGLSQTAESVQPELNSTQANESFEIATDVFGGIGQGAGTGIVHFGAAAIVLIALGILVATYSGGR